MYALEAGVELLCRSFGGRFASPGQPWVRHRPGGFWSDRDALRELTGALSGGEQRVLAVVRSLACDGPPTDLVRRNVVELVDVPAGRPGRSRRRSPVNRSTLCFSERRLTGSARTSSSLC